MPRSLVALLLLLLSGVLSACSPPDGSAAMRPDPSAVEAALREALAESNQRRRELEEELQRRSQQAKELEQRLAWVEERLAELQQGSGYKAALRIIYTGLEQGDSAALRLLLSPDEPVEAGFTVGDLQTYRRYPDPAEIDFGPFNEYARRHPLASATLAVHTAPFDYATATASFPDGTHFGLTFFGSDIIKIQVSDTPVLGDA